MSSATYTKVEPGDRVRLRALPRTHQHLTGKYGTAVEVPSDSTVAVVLEGRGDALLVHVTQAVFVSRPVMEKPVSETDDEVSSEDRSAESTRIVWDEQALDWKYESEVSRPPHVHTWVETENPCGTCLGTEHAALYCEECDRLVCLNHEVDPRKEHSDE